MSEVLILYVDQQRGVRGIHLGPSVNVQDSIVSRACDVTESLTHSLTLLCLSVSLGVRQSSAESQVSNAMGHFLKD